MHDGPKTFRFELAGDLIGPEVAKLDQAWRTASSTFDGKVQVIDITYLNEVDHKGRELLARWSEAKAHFVANSEASRQLAASITGRPYEVSEAAAGQTFEPRFTASTVRTAIIALILTVTMLFPGSALA